jgi:chaperonin GroES
MHLDISGIDPIEYKVLVRPKTAANKTAGGIMLPEVVVEKDQHASMEGTVCAVSPLAFSYEDGAPKAKPGDTVIFARYSGINVKGCDGAEYRLMNDKDIVAVRRSA